MAADGRLSSCIGDPPANAEACLSVAVPKQPGRSPRVGTSTSVNAGRRWWAVRQWVARGVCLQVVAHHRAPGTPRPRPRICFYDRRLGASGREAAVFDLRAESTTDSVPAPFWTQLFTNGRIKYRSDLSAAGGVGGPWEALISAWNQPGVVVCQRRFDLFGGHLRSL